MVNCPAGELDRSSYQEWLLRLPVNADPYVLNLCISPPCVAGREGETTRGRAVVNRHGNAVQGTVVQGDHCRQPRDRGGQAEVAAGHFPPRKKTRV